MQEVCVRLGTFGKAKRKRPVRFKRCWLHWGEPLEHDGVCCSLCIKTTWKRQYWRQQLDFYWEQKGLI